jgi:mono/diheme cytochrome c family protein
VKRIAFLITLLAASIAQAQVKSIELPKYQPYLPPGPNRELFATSCLSCHATRYITMQPVMTQAKWEESVKKMIKTYGAPLSEDLATPIAQYLVTFQQSPLDPLSRVTANPEPKISIDSSAGDTGKGKAVYARACASCHGAEGKGDGPAMANLLPVATNFTTGHFARGAVVRAITHGVPGTSMPAFPSLSASDVQDVVAYVTQMSGAIEPTLVSDQAKVLFTQNCASCHGNDGRGDGFNAPVLPRGPTNFTQRQPATDQALKAITDGVAGTPMPSWKAKLTDAQRKDLADYVRTLYHGD